MDAESTVGYKRYRGKRLGIVNGYDRERDLAASVP